MATISEARTIDPPGDLRGVPATAFERLADRHLDASYRLARAILRDPTEAEDLVGGTGADWDPPGETAEILEADSGP
jgi:hypothetical protein